MNRRVVTLTSLPGPFQYYLGIKWLKTFHCCLIPAFSLLRLHLQLDCVCIHATELFISLSRAFSKKRARNGDQSLEFPYRSFTSTMSNKVLPPKSSSYGLSPGSSTCSVSRPPQPSASLISLTRRHSH